MQHLATILTDFASYRHNAHTPRQHIADVRRISDQLRFNETERDEKSWPIVWKYQQ